MGRSTISERDGSIMKSKIIWFIAAAITGMLLLITFAPVNEISKAAETAIIDPATATTTDYTSATGAVGRYQDFQAFLASNVWWIICLIIITIIIISAGQLRQGGDNDGQ